MPMWSGLGINLNFTGSGVDIPTQLAELYGLGFRRVRLLVIGYQSASLDTWKGYAESALDMGFEEVCFGISFGVGTGLGTSTQAAYLTAIDGFATWAQGVNDPRLEMHVGNEEELHHDGTMTAADVREFMRGCATAAKAIYTTGTICYCSSVANGAEIASWASEGLGDLDRIGFNLYDTLPMFTANVAAIASGFSGSGFVSEWGTNNGYIDFNNETLYKNAIFNRQQALVNAGVTEGFYYNFMESGNKWGIKLHPITGDFREAWPSLLGIRPWFTGNPNVQITWANTPVRANTPSRSSTPNRSSIV